MALIGFRPALGLHPRLPQGYLSHELPSRFFPKVLAATRGWLRMLEYVLKPRLRFLRGRIVLKRIGGGIIAASGLLLLPIPIPFSNFFPTVTGFHYKRQRTGGGWFGLPGGMLQLFYLRDFRLPADYYLPKS